MRRRGRWAQIAHARIVDNSRVRTKGHWDIFCKVIDNYGDVGVCWRLCCDLASRGQSVRLWIDDPSALRWMAPAGHPSVEIAAWQGVEITLFSADKLSENINFHVIIESFGCEISPKFVADSAIFKRTIDPFYLSWINLEYISAEKYAEHNHQLPSPVLSGPAKGLTKHFFYPGFTPRTGGLLRETDLQERQARFAKAPWPNWLQTHAASGELTSRSSDEQLISLFCYEPDALGDLLTHLATAPKATCLLVTHGRAHQAVAGWVDGQKRSRRDRSKHLANSRSDSSASTGEVIGSLRICYLPAITQLQYDELLWACDLNFVRGEDSLVRALWAGKPFVWQIYPQDDGAHHIKLEAFLQFLGANDSWAAFHRAWNRPPLDTLATGPNGSVVSAVSPASVASVPSADVPASDASSADPALPALPAVANLPSLDLANWGRTALQARERLLAQPDLTTQLMQFVSSHHA